MHLQKSVEPFDVFARALTIGPETMVMHFRPDEPMHDRYAVDHDFLSAAVGPGGDHHRPDGERLLPLGVQLLRDAGPGRHRAADRLRQRLPGRGGHLAALLLPVGDEGAGEVDGLLRRDRPQGQAARRHRRRGSRSPTIRTWTTAPSWRRYQQLADEHFDTERYHEFCAEALPRHRRAWCWSGSSSPRLRPDAGGHDQRDLSRARAGAVHRPLPRPGRSVGHRRADAARLRGDPRCARDCLRPAGRRSSGWASR